MESGYTSAVRTQTDEGLRLIPRHRQRVRTQKPGDPVTQRALIVDDSTTIRIILGKMPAELGF